MMVHVEGKEPLPRSLHEVPHQLRKKESQHSEGILAAMVADIEMMPLFCRDILGKNVKMVIKHA